MSRPTDNVLIALGAFAGGVLIGFLFAPESGTETRRELQRGATSSSKWLEEHLEDTRRRMLDIAEEASDRIRERTAEAVSRVLPDIGSNDDAWDEIFEDTEEDIRKDRR